MKIEVLPYNSEWPDMFQKIKDELSSTLYHLNPQIEHIGSTSVPGLSAKPYIDILIGLKENMSLDLVVEPMMKAGFPYYELYNKDMPYRRLFVKMGSTSGLKYPLKITEEMEIPEIIQEFKLAHIHILHHNTDNWYRHIAFRDYLRTFPDVCQAYQELKVALSKLDWKNVMEYNNGKNDFIKKTESEALHWYHNLHSQS